MISPEEVVDKAIDEWLAIDPDPDTTRQLAELRDLSPPQARALFDGRIAFGTAGLRAPMGPGPLQMNQLVVQQTTEGLMNWLAARSAGQIRVVIGFDGRHNSKKFADQVAQVIAGYGGVAELISEPAPTPVLARAVLDRSASAGVMITASHNPAPDNGYKLYLDDGIQLSSPADAEIAAAIDEAVAAGRAESPGLNLDEHSARPGSGTVEILGPEVLERHQAAAIGVLRSTHRQVSMLYTPIHGIGGTQALACFHAAGFPLPAVVAAQFGPDPDFPTAPYPNPEDPIALRPALDEASRLQQAGVDLDLIIANDPDADRLAVTVWDSGRGWTQLTGDQLGVLLADHILRHEKEPLDQGHLIASSVVSSLMVPKIAKAAGVSSVRTLTGFKWVARPIVDQPNATYLFGYEEALGFCIGDQVRDKDGISAALLLAEAAAELKVDGITLLDRLDELYLTHGIHLSGQVVVDLGAMNDSERNDAKARALALDPDSIDSIPVVEREDLADGKRMPPTAGIILQLQDGSRVVVRPSGTEPKIKAYLEVIDQLQSNEDSKHARERVQQRLESLKRSVANQLGNN